MKRQKKENTLLSLAFNIAIPSILLIWAGKFLKARGIEQLFGIDALLCVFLLALAFPTIYGIYDLIARKKWNIIAIIGVASVFLTGGIGVMRLSREWIIAKETLVPLVLGIAVTITAFTKKPLAKLLILNDTVLDVNKIEKLLNERGTKAAFDREFLIATWLCAFSFLLSAALNFYLACRIFTENATMEQFNEQVGKMTALSWPVIVLPTTIFLIAAMFKVFSAIKKYCGVSFEDVLSPQLQENKK